MLADPLAACVTGLGPTSREFRFDSYQISYHSKKNSPDSAETQPAAAPLTLASFRDIAVKRKILVHINNSNPILVDGSTERGLLAKAGWEVAHDGMEVSP